LQRPSPALAALTFKDPARTQVGNSFLDLVAVDDRKQCTEHLDSNGPSSTLECAPMLHVRLLDVNGMPFSVQLFHSRFGDAFDQVCHAVGIREVQESWGRQPHASNAMATRRIASNDESPPGRASDGDCFANSVGSCSTGCPLLLDPSESPNEVSVWVDAGVPGYPISRSTANFIMISGPMLATTNFIKYISGDHQDVFHHWVQESINYLHNGCGNGVPNMRIRLCTSDEAVFVFKADCTVHFDSPATPINNSAGRQEPFDWAAELSRNATCSAAEPDLPIRLRLSNITQHRVKPKGSQTNRWKTKADGRVDRMPRNYPPQMIGQRRQKL